MARLDRYFLPDQPLHVIQRGNNRAAAFFCDDDDTRYRGWLADAAAEYGCTIHAYVLMTNHVHLLVTPASTDSLPRTMQSLGRRYVRHVNGAYRRTGPLWEGRYRAAPIASEAHFLACWLLHRAQSHARRDGGASPRVSVVELARSRAGRGRFAGEGPSALPRARPDGGGPAKEYRALFRAALDQGFVDALRAATNSGWALGAARFKREIAKATGRRVAPLPKGRPRKGKRDRRQLTLLAPNSSRSLNNGRPTLVGRLSSETASDLDGPERIAPA
jgi:putative transposase